jgi:hypothetical protein
VDQRDSAREPLAGLLDRLTKVTAAASGVAGLVVYVYVLGGLVVWARLTATRLYTNSAVDALGSKSLLATGLKVVAFELAALAVLSGCAWALWRVRAARSESNDAPETRPTDIHHASRPEEPADARSNEDKKGPIRVGWLIVQGILVVFVAVCVLALASIPPVWALIAGGLWVVVGLVCLESDFFRFEDNRLLAVVLGVPVVVAAIFFSAAAPGISAVILFVLLLNHARFDDRLVDDNSTRLIAPVVTLLAALSVIVLAFLTTPPVTFDRVTVLMKHGKTVEGGYVARSGDGVFVATCKQVPGDTERSKLPRLRVIPNDSVKRVILGGDRYAIDNGKRPSLFDLGLHLFLDKPIEENFRAWRPSIRGRQAVCVDTKTG